MNACFTSGRAAIAAAGGLVIALCFSGVAQAITDTVFKYSTPKTGYYSINHHAMNPVTSAVASNYSHGDGLTTQVQGCFSTGVNLPHGVTLTGVRVWYSSGVNTNPDFSFHVQRLSTATDSAYLRTPQDDSGTLKIVNIPIIDIPKVDNSLNTYAFVACISFNDAFYAARITYTYDNAGD